MSDISFVCDLSQFLREGHYEEQLSARSLALVSADGPNVYPNAYEHMLKLSEEPVFRERMGSYLNWYRKRIGRVFES